MLRAFSFSLAGHTALLLAMLGLSALGPPVRVMEIARPVRLVMDLPALPPPARPARIPEPAPARPRVAPPPRAREAARPAPAPLVIPKVLEPVRDAPAPKPAPAPAPSKLPDLRDRLERRIAEPPVTAPEPALPRIASLPDPEREAAPPPRAAPVPTPAAAGPVVPLMNFPFAGYIGVLQKRVLDRWNVPGEFFLDATGIEALVAFRVDRAGRVSRVELRRSSGYERFDRSAVATVAGLASVAPLPAEYREDHLDVVITFRNE